MQLDHRLQMTGGYQTWELMTTSKDVEGRTDPLANGVRGHEKIASYTPDSPVKETWRKVIDGERLRLHDQLLIGMFEEIYLSGHPDLVIFADQKPKFVLEFKFSAKNIPSAWHHSQVGFYCYLLGEMGFDVDKLPYVIGIFPPDSHRSEALRKAPNYILEKFPFRRESMELSEGKVKFVAKLYDHPDTVRELSWAVDYWRGVRDPVPTKIDWKCRACFASDICEFSLA